MINFKFHNKEEFLIRLLTKGIRYCIEYADYIEYRGCNPGKWGKRSFWLKLSQVDILFIRGMS